MDNSKEIRYLKAFGKRIAEVRRARNLTQEQLAEQSGLTALSVGYIEQGRRWPRISTLQKLAKSLDVPVSEFFKGL